MANITGTFTGLRSLPTVDGDDRDPLKVFTVEGIQAFFRGTVEKPGDGSIVTITTRTYWPPEGADNRRPQIWLSSVQYPNGSRAEIGGREL